MNNMKMLNRFVLGVSVVAVSLFFSLYAFGSVKAEIVADDIIAYYPLIEDTGAVTTCRDYFDTDNDLTLENPSSPYTPNWVTSIFGGGLQLYGTGTTGNNSAGGCVNSSVPLPYQLPMVSGGEFSLSIIYKNPSSAPSVQAMLFDWGQQNEQAVGTLSVQSSGALRFAFENTSHVYPLCETSAGTITFDGAHTYNIQAVGEMGNLVSSFILYINGSPITCTWTGSPDSTPRNDSPSTLTFELGMYKPYLSNAYYGINGILGEAVLFNRILTSDEVVQLQSNSLSSLLTPVSSDYILYYGENPLYLDIDKHYTAPIVYDVCDTFQPGHSYGIRLVDDNNDAVGVRRELTECSGSIEYDIYSGIADYSATAKFVLSDMAEDDYYTENWLLESNEFLYAVYTLVPEKSDYLISNISQPIYIDTTRAGTTTIPVGFRVCDEADWAQGTIQLIDDFTDTSFGGESANTMEYLNLSCLGQQQYEIAWTAGYNGSASVHFEYMNPTRLFRTQSFMIIMYSNKPIDVANSEFQSMCTYDGDFFSDGLCYLGNAIVQPMLVNSYNFLVKLFPFNIAQKFYDSFVDSNESDIDDDYAFLFATLDNSGDLYINLPDKFSGGTDEKLLVFGNTVFLTNSDMASFFGFMRKLSALLLWALFMFTMYKKGNVLVRLIKE